MKQMNKFTKRRALAISYPKSQISVDITGLDFPGGQAVHGNHLYMSKCNSGEISRIRKAQKTIKDHMKRSTDQFGSSFITAPQVEKYTIYDVFGTVVSTGMLYDHEIIDVKKYPNGLYFLKFENETILKFSKKTGV